MPPDDYEIIEQALQRLQWAEQKKFSQLLALHNLTLPQFLVLMAIRRRGAGCPIGTLAEEMWQAYPTMTGIVDRLKEAGLVARADDPNDRRKVVVQLTAAGRTLLERARGARRARMIRALAHFSPRERRELVRLVKKYLEALEKEAE